MESNRGMISHYLTHDVDPREEDVVQVPRCLRCWAGMMLDDSRISGMKCTDCGTEEYYADTAKLKEATK